MKKDEELSNAKGRDTHFLKLIMFKMSNIILVHTRSFAFLKQK